MVSVLMKFRSGLVNERHEDKTALQIASHQGHTGVLDTLIEAGADPGLGDRLVASGIILHLPLLT